MIARSLLLLASLALPGVTFAAGDAGDEGPLAIPGSAPPPRSGPRGQPQQRPAEPARVVTSGPTYQVRPYHGVFVYGPRTTYHRYYRSQPRQTVRADHMPTRRVDRNQSFGVGVRGGALMSGYRQGPLFGDFGLGALVRYRPIEVFGIELLAEHHSESWDRKTERAQTIGQLSAMLHITPWARLSPYLLGGLTGTFRHADDRVDFEDYGKRFLFGPHGGVGLEFNIGKHIALDLEGRFAGYVNVGDDPVTPRGSFQTNAALVAYF